MSRELKIRNILMEVMEEYRNASLKFKPFNSAHEGYAVIKEEVDELWEEVKKKKSDRKDTAMRAEALQIAAMGLRFVLDVCDKEAA